MRKIYLLCLFLSGGYVLTAQDKLEADRPGESRSPELVKGNHLQAEFGFRKEKLTAGIHEYQHPSATIRYGLFNAIELRAEIITQTLRNTVSKETRNGLVPVEFGIKAKILPEYKGLPSLAILGQVGVPKFSSEDFYDGRLPVEVRALFGNTLTSQWKIQYNTGVKWHGKDREAQWMYSFSPVYKMNDKINLFIEEYAFLGKSSSPEHYLDGGLDFFVTNNFMLDFSAGVGLSSASSPYFIAAGASFRLGMR